MKTGNENKIRLIDKRGYSYYITEEALPDHYKDYDNLIRNVVNYVDTLSESNCFIACCADMMLRDKTLIRADQIIEIQEVTHNR